MADRKPASDNVFTKEQIHTWKQRYEPGMVDAYLEFFDPVAMNNAVDLLLLELIDGKAFNRGFLSANLEKRQNEAKMVGAEVRMFNATADLMEQSVEMRKQLRGTLNSEMSVAALSAINDGFKSVADLINALAAKNNTMGEGVPGGGGTTTGPGGTAIPGDGPEDGTTTKPPCYERYRRRIEELWRQKDQMGDGVMWWLLWADALKDLTLCAGPQAVKLLLELLGAAKK